MNAPLYDPKTAVHDSWYRPMARRSGYSRKNDHSQVIAGGTESFRLDGLSKREKDALEKDLELAVKVQRGLLPRRSLAYGEWRISYHYEPAGLVSGDYCDVIDAGNAGVYFLVGDVCGKGLAASIVTAHLHGMFRTLIAMNLPLQLMLERASRTLYESHLPYATLVCGRAQQNGRVEICNAGHPLPLVVKEGCVTAVEESSLPAGIMPDQTFSTAKVELQDGQSLVLYSDGVSEARNTWGSEYGIARLRKLVGEQHAVDPSALVAACREELAAFCRGTEKRDDVTILALARAASDATLIQ